jgi:hypothetical protein
MRTTSGQAKVLDDAGCEPKATITHLYVQSIRVTNVETVGVLLRLLGRYPTFLNICA